MTKNHFWSYFSPFQINTQLLFFWILFTKWRLAAIFDDRKSLSIAFLAISDKHNFFWICSQNGCRRPFWMTENMKLIGEFMTELGKPQAVWEFVYKMAARGHFVFPIDAKNHRVLVIWDLNGYGEYEFDWRICDKVMACTSVGVRRRRRRRRRNQKHNITEIFKFRGYNYIEIRTDAPSLGLWKSAGASSLRVPSGVWNVITGAAYNRVLNCGSTSYPRRCSKFLNLTFKI